MFMWNPLVRKIIQSLKNFLASHFQEEGGGSADYKNFFVIGNIFWQVGNPIGTFFYFPAHFPPTLRTHPKVRNTIRKLRSVGK